MLDDRTRYVMHDQVRDQIPSIMEGSGPPGGSRALATHLAVTGAVSLLYTVLIVLAQ